MCCKFVAHVDVESADVVAYGVGRQVLWRKLFCVVFVFCLSQA